MKLFGRFDNKRELLESLVFDNDLVIFGLDFSKLSGTIGIVVGVDLLVKKTERITRIIM